MDSYFDLGGYSRTITTKSDDAQRWFNRGLKWCYAFHHTEAVCCFKKVVEVDPTCAMGYWGLAYALGPYYNITWVKMPAPLLQMALVETFKNSRKAHSLLEGASPVEEALIEAFLVRFQADHVEEGEEEETFAQWDNAYANAMRDVYARFPLDYDVCALTAEALMVRTPWQLWELTSGKPADGADTLEAMTVLETALNRTENQGDVRHPGLHHFYIHCMEMSPEPEKALAVSDRLRTMMPDAGHLTHMPSHIYVLCGQYAKTIETNVEAVMADDKYLLTDSTPGIFYLYHSHNIHFQVYGALFSGQYKEALRAANSIEERFTEGTLRSIEPEFLANFVEWIYAVKAHVYIRFGKWEEIIAEPMPSDSELYAVTTTTWHYAKGVAHAVLGNIDQALEQQMLFRVALSAIPEERITYQNASAEVLAVGDAMLDGELEYRRGNYDVAFDHLRRSVTLYDNLNYAEPWTWMQPPRHALGALLLEQGHVAEAAQIYRADLGLDDTLQRSSQHPNNIWSLHGYAECCQLLGDEEGHMTIQKELEEAQAIADIEVNASCFCRRADHCCG